MPSLHVPVLIVGGGGCGLSSSIFLSTLGIPSMLSGAAPHTGRMPKARYLNQRAMEIFRQFGVADAIYQRSMPLEHMSQIRWATSLGGDGPLDRRKFSRWNASVAARLLIMRRTVLARAPSTRKSGSSRCCATLLRKEGRDGCATTMRLWRSGRRRAASMCSCATATAEPSDIQAGLCDRRRRRQNSPVRSLVYAWKAQPRLSTWPPFISGRTSQNGGRTTMR